MRGFGYGCTILLAPDTSELTCGHSPTHSVGYAGRLLLLIVVILLCVYPATADKPGAS